MKIGIYGQFYHANSEIHIQELLSLLKEAQVNFILEEGFSKIMKDNKIIGPQYTDLPTFKTLDSSFDLFFSIGGDGTILKSVNFVKNLNIPIVGINTGRLGFLSTIQKEEIKRSLAAILNKDYVISTRSLLALEISDEKHKLSASNFALNDIVINRKNSTSMITVETWLNDQYLTAYWADGLIITTATGSTGYSMSCGGPIIAPQTDAIGLTPIAPHNLNARPLIVPSSTVLTLKVDTREDEFLVAMDSNLVSLKKETRLTIKKAPFTIDLVTLNDDSFVRTLRQKLLWGEDKRNSKH